MRASSRDLPAESEVPGWSDLGSSGAKSHGHHARVPAGRWSASVAVARTRTSAVRSRASRSVSTDAEAGSAWCRSCSTRTTGRSPRGPGGPGAGRRAGPGRSGTTSPRPGRRPRPARGRAVRWWRRRPALSLGPAAGSGAATRTTTGPPSAPAASCPQNASASVEVPMPGSPVSRTRAAPPRADAVEALVEARNPAPTRPGGASQEPRLRSPPSPARVTSCSR